MSSPLLVEIFVIKLVSEKIRKWSRVQIQERRTMGYRLCKDIFPGILKEVLDAAVSSFRSRDFSNRVVKSLFPQPVCNQPTPDVGHVHDHINCQIYRANEKTAEVMLYLLILNIVLMALLISIAAPKLKIWMSARQSSKTVNIQTQSCGVRERQHTIDVDQF